LYSPSRRITTLLAKNGSPPILQKIQNYLVENTKNTKTRKIQKKTQKIVKIRKNTKKHKNSEN
jgi:hypothetical protein